MATSDCTQVSREHANGRKDKHTIAHLGGRNLHHFHGVPVLALDEQPWLGEHPTLLTPPVLRQHGTIVPDATVLAAIPTNARGLDRDPHDPLST